MSNELPEPEKHFVWKKLVKFYGPDERLITPIYRLKARKESDYFHLNNHGKILHYGDPLVYEHPMDLLFASEQLAHNALVDYELVEQAIEEKWMLCVHEITPISFVIETLIPKE